MDKLRYSIMFLVGLGFFQSVVPALSNQLVLAGRGAGNVHLNAILLSTSRDGTMWSSPSPVILNGTPAQTIAPPNIFSDGFLYHLLWMGPNGDVRYATSRDALNWLAQESPLMQLPPQVQTSFTQGAGKFLALLKTDRGEAVVQDLHNPVGRTTVLTSVDSASIAFSSNKFVLAVSGFDQPVRIFESTDGVSWTQIATTLPSAPNRTVNLNFAEGRFLLAARTPLRTGGVIPLVDCTYLESLDARSWSQISISPCGNTFTGLLPMRWQGHNLLFVNADNQRLFVSVDFGPEQLISGIELSGQPSIAIGPLPAPPPPPTASCPTINAVQNVAIMPVTLTGRGGGGGPFTFSATGLPNDLVMSSSGTISGTPTVVGPFNYTVTVTSNTGATGTISCAGTVNPAPPPPCIAVHIPIPLVDCHAPPVCPAAGKQTCDTVPHFSIQPCINTESVVVAYTTPAQHCATIKLNLWTTGPDGMPGTVVTTQTQQVGVGTVSQVVPFPSNFVADGQRLLQLHVQAVGVLDGCNVGCLASWTGSLDLIFPQR